MSFSDFMLTQRRVLRDKLEQVTGLTLSRISELMDRGDFPGAQCGDDGLWTWSLDEIESQRANWRVFLDSTSEIEQDSIPIAETNKESGRGTGMEGNGTDREDREVILGSAPLIDVAGTEPLPGFRPLTFDPQEFMAFVQDEDLTEEEAIVLLRAIWDIVVAFVDLGFGVHPIQQALVDRSRGPDSGSALPVLASVFHSEVNRHKPSTLATRSGDAKEES